MASPAKTFGYILQVTGLLVMFFAFFQLAGGFQNTFSVVLASMQSIASSEPDTRPVCEPGELSPDCRVDFSSQNAISDTFAPVINNYILLIALGVALLFAGLILHSISEMGDRWVERGQKKKEKIRIGTRIAEP